MSDNNYDYDKLFDDEFKSIKEELDNIDTLYEEVKTHYDEIKDSQFKGSLTFIEKQTTNLVNLKNTKLNLLKEKMNAKKTLVELSLKKRTVDQKENQMNNDTESSIDALTNLLKEIKYERNDTESILEDNSLDLDEELDNIISESGEEVVVEDSINDLSKDEDSSAPKEDTFIGVDLDSNLFYELNGDYEIVKELGHLEDIKKTTEYDGTSYAIGISGDSYVVISVETE